MSRCVSLALLLATCLATSAHAHRLWLLPSATVLSAPGDWVTVDAAVSNELFYFNHVPLRLDNLSITSPSGSKIAPQNMSTGKFRSTFDAELSEAGTYRIAVVNDALIASYKENGTVKRWRGRPEDFARQIPANATELRVVEMSNRIETFVTAGKPSEILAVGKGLELVPITHPTDLFAQEPARFRFLIDGKPAAGLEVSIIPGGIRYRDRLEEIRVTTDAEGDFTVTWPNPGMYWINASAQDDRTGNRQASERRLNYSGTFEVMAP